MGVHNLWDLLAPCGRRCSIDSLARKRLAVDASIWLIQFIKAMRDVETGEMLHNAPQLGLFRRLCKLLFLHVRPLLVFDGGAPLALALSTSPFSQPLNSQLSPLSPLSLPSPLSLHDISTVSACSPLREPSTPNTTHEHARGCPTSMDSARTRPGRVRQAPRPSRSGRWLGGASFGSGRSRRSSGRRNGSSSTR